MRHRTPATLLLALATCAAPIFSQQGLATPGADSQPEARLEAQSRAAEEEWLDFWRTGPTGTTWKRVPLQVGDRAPSLELRDATGELVALDSFWSQGPALIVFWRHFGCGCGVQRAERLRSEIADYISLGASVVVVGQGEPERSAVYAEAQDLQTPILSDPTYSAYNAFDLLEGQVSQIMYDAPEEYMRLDFETGRELQQSRHGTARALVDNPWLLPGEFVVDQAGVVRLAYRYQHCQDWPNQELLTAAIKEAARDEG